MFTRLCSRVMLPAHALKPRLRNHRLRIASPAMSIASIRHQSSSSSSRDNDNNNNADVEPISADDAPVNASFELHRVDLAHGSFFALHRPLLGIANGPMFASSSTMHEEEYEDPVDELIHYFSSLQPYTPPEPMDQSPLATLSATTWASFPQTLMDAELVADEFLSMVDDKQKQQLELDRSEEIQPSDPLLSANPKSQTEATPGTTTDTTTTSTAAAATAADTTAESPAESISAAAEDAFESILDPLRSVNMMYLTSVLRKRRIKMRKHKYKKLRKRTRALRKKLGK